MKCAWLLVSAWLNLVMYATHRIAVGTGRYVQPSGIHSTQNCACLPRTASRGLGRDTPPARTPARTAYGSVHQAHDLSHRLLVAEMHPPRRLAIRLEATVGLGRSPRQDHRLRDRRHSSGVSRPSTTEQNQMASYKFDLIRAEVRRVSLRQAQDRPFSPRDKVARRAGRVRDGSTALPDSWW